MVKRREVAYTFLASSIRGDLRSVRESAEESPRGTVTLRDFLESAGAAFPLIDQPLPAVRLVEPARRTARAICSTGIET